MHGLLSRLPFGSLQSGLDGFGTEKIRLRKRLNSRKLQAARGRLGIGFLLVFLRDGICAVSLSARLVLQIRKYYGNARFSGRCQFRGVWLEPYRLANRWPAAFVFS